MTLTEVAEKANAQHKGKKLLAHCPCHDDQNPSVEIKEGDSGVLVKCRAGCKTEDVVGAWGMKMSDLFPEKKEQEPPTYYTYTDRHGRPMVREVKNYPKKFHVEHLSNGEWKNGMNGHSPELYNVCNVMSAVAAGKVVWVVEGAKDAETLIKKGHTATTNILGAGKWKPLYTDALKGGKVVIVADKDEPGYRHALTVYESLRHSCKVKVVEAKEGKDATDHFVAGHGLEDFVEIGELGLKQRLGMAPQTVGWTMANKVETEKIDMLVHPYIPIGEITFMAGDPGEGKSTIAQAICASCTNGGSILGREVVQGNVIFMSAEQSRASVTVPRFRDMDADLSKIALPDEDGDDGEVRPFVLDEEGFRALDQFVAELKPVIIVVDTVTAYIEAQRDFNSANQVREWMRRLGKIARVRRCAVLVLGHLNKNTNAKPLHRVMGSVDFTGAARSVLFVGHDPDNKGAKALVHIKSNVGPIGPSLGYSIEDGVFGWTAESDLDADRMCEPAQTREARETHQECAEWLRHYLITNGATPNAEIEAKAKEKGWGRRVVDAAKKLAGAQKEKDGMAGGWAWFIP